tara:strand:- start:257 stop:1030 length:774 start_codon:yes stop_codon:yes gene_type:complete
MIIDSHCHLDYASLYDQLDGVVKRAVDNDVKYLLTINTTLKSFEKVKLIVQKYKNVFGTFGIHPHESKNHINIDSKYIHDLINSNKKIIGVGETGLDFYYNHSDKTIQKKSFTEHIHSAINLNLPIIVHSRNAETETYEILKSESKNSNLKILIHCFTGSKDFSKKLLDINSYISLSGIITFSKTNDLADTISSIPLDKLLVETDSPYLSPIPYRGKSNEPSYIIHTVNRLAEIKKVSKKSVMHYTTNNFKKLFSVP